MSDVNLDAFWMPFTHNRAYKANPRLFTGAKGMYYQDQHGRDILDGTAGLWCVNAGHGRDLIVQAVAEQVAKMDYAPCFNLGHDKAFEAATALAAMAPEGFNKVFFTNSGSESADTALKMALAYHGARGDHKRIKFIGREKGYHGVNFGGTSVGGIIGNRKAFNHLLPFVAHLQSTHDLEHNAFSKGLPEHGGIAMAEDLEKRIFALHDPSSIAAVIVEPMSGSAGVILPPKGYLQRLRELCSQHGILLIFDEVITGFGRTGSAWGAETFGVMPDIITCAKGLTNGTIPMGAVLVRDDFYHTVVDEAPAGIEFAHGYTYSAHPVACAAALATLQVYQSEGLFERAARLAPMFEQAAHALKDLPWVKDIRNIGLVAGIELHSKAQGVGQRAAQVFAECWDAGVLVRVTADTIAISPPLMVNEAEIERIFSTIAQAVGRLD